MSSVMNFGSALRRARIDAGVSLAELAKSAHYSKGYLSKIENGLSTPSVHVARRCDSVLGRGGDLAALVPVRPAGKSSPVGELSTGLGDGTWSMGFGDTGSWFVNTNNPDDPAVGGSSSMAFRLPLAGPPGEGAAAIGTAFTAFFEQLREIGRRTHPATVLPMLISQIAVVRRLAEVADEPVRTTLVALAARCAEYAGWMAQEAGDERAALWWTSKAEQFALAIRDRDLVAYALVRQAEFALYRDDPLSTIELASRAGRLPGVLLRTRALAAQREAQGYALAGERARCWEALGRAVEYLREADAETREVAPLGSTTITDLGAVAAGWCAYDLGDTDLAIELLGTGLAGIPPASVRVRALFGARLALAHEAAGHHDDVERLAREVLRVAPTIGSASVRSQLRMLGRALARSSHRSGVRDLQVAFAEVLRDPRSGGS